MQKLFTIVTWYDVRVRVFRVHLKLVLTTVLQLWRAAVCVHVVWLGERVYALVYV